MIRIYAHPYIIAIFLVILIIGGCRQGLKSRGGATLALINGKVWTVDENQPVAEAVAVQGDRIIAVGTTTVRVLESCCLRKMRPSISTKSGNKRVVEAGKGWTELFIYPGYEFNVVDGLITNFHLPESTLLMLVAAFAGKDKVFQAYEQAIKEKYRFYSYGDAMFII